jgi:hypothetical protein
MARYHLALLSLLVTAVFAQSSTASNSTAQHSSTDRVGFKWGSTDRSTLVLLWSCLATIFTCTWTVIHLDIAPDRYTTRRILFRKFKWMAITVIAPEMTFGMAFAQFIACRRLRSLIRKNGQPDWSMVQSFYAVMGGYKVQHGTLSKLLTPEGVVYLIKESPETKIPSKKDVEKLAKADGFAKLVACIQAGWLVAQSIARSVEHLPISKLEIATLALVANAVITYLLWWKKPYDANQRTIFTLDDTSPLSKFLLEKESLYFYCDDKLGIETVKDTGFNFLYGGMTFFGVICGGMHCFAWNFEFATPKEQLLWRICSILVTGSVVLGGLILLPVIKSEYENDLFKNLRLSLLVLCLLTYIAGRLVLVFVAFYSLRSEPMGVYNSVA